MAIFDDAIFNVPAYESNFAGYTGDAPTNEAEYNALDCWKDKAAAPTWAGIQSAITKLQDQQQAAKDAKASALAKLSALGLTQDEVKALLG
jgi:hypothetical protein